MFATVYRTRSKGVRLPAPSRPDVGRLSLATRNDGTTQQLFARLMAETGDTLVLPELLHARVRRISANGIVITGQEVVPRRGNNKSNADFWQQTWWCLVHTVAIAEAFDVMDLDSSPFGSIGEARSTS
jgi:hypothetical protein